MTLEAQKITIKDLNRRGEGFSADDPTLNVPGALPGETVVITPRYKRKGVMWGELNEVITPSPDRIAPPCPHASTCGGCSLQHVSASFYRTFKSDLITDALTKAGLQKDLDHFISMGPHSRRRVDFWAKHWDDEIRMGFHQTGSNARLVNLQTCLIMSPALESLIDPLRQLMSTLLLHPREKCHIHLVEGDNGIDCLLSGRKRLFAEAELNILKEFAEKHLCRLQIKQTKKPQTLFCPEAPYVIFGGVKVSIDPNAFLQATKTADKALSDCVLQALQETPTQPHKIADLYCGRGTLTLPLVAAGYHVTGFEGDKRSIHALSQAAETSCMLRDLYQDPLTKEELGRFHAIVLNPPRTGATNQINAIAQSGVQTIVYVSCGPESFARDARTLEKEGYNLTHLTAVDQFHWAAHVEVVGVFRK